nr:unnamed protein product [Callosobruchus chinensis]
MQRGQFMFETKGKLSAVKWMDSKCVHVISNYFCPKETATRSLNIIKLWEVSINSTNSSKDMLLDEDLQNGGIYTIVNSFILMNTSKKKKGDQLTFRINLARQLINGYSSKKRRNRPVFFLPNKRAVPDEVRLSEVGKHLPFKMQHIKDVGSVAQKRKRKGRDSSVHPSYLLIHCERQKISFHLFRPRPMKGLNEQLETDYNNHIRRKNEANLAKEEDKVRSNEDSTFMSVTFDLQSVLQMPSGEESLLYYCRKLCLYN